MGGVVIDERLRPAETAPPRSGVAVAYVIGTYPLPTTTFIDREVREVRRAVADVRLVSIRRPTRALSGADQEALRDEVRYVLPARALDVARSQATFLARRPVAYVRTVAWLATRPHPSLRARVRTVGHFGLGVHVARLLRDGGAPDHLHAHFADRAATVALVAGRLLDRPYSVTAHANDIYVDPVLLPEKIGRASFVATCTAYNAAHLRAVGGPAAAEKVRCLYHGLDLDGYPAPASRDGSAPALLAVGQLKEKKGLGDLVDACALLAERGVDVRCRLVGEGPLRDALAERIERHGLGGRVTLEGALPHAAVIDAYAAASVFALPCVTASDGDRDGIPNVILEAMAMGLPVVSTRHSGIPEAVQDGLTGLLVEPGGVAALADALAALLDDPARREQMGTAGRQRVASLFDARTNVARLVEGFVA
ncbi:MAG: glycosyltransferase [Planctomycetaceae bacterium]